jgi:hypothetical protein
MTGLPTRKASFALALIIGLAGPGAALATEGAVHYEGEPAETLEQAVANFSEYNARLSAVLEKGELTAEDMETVHELTYTLENALQTIDQELAELAETLEAMHLASESQDAGSTSQHGADYLNTARTVIP